MSKFPTQMCVCMGVLFKLQAQQFLYYIIYGSLQVSVSPAINHHYEPQRGGEKN